MLRETKLRSPDILLALSLVVAGCAGDGLATGADIGFLTLENPCLPDCGKNTAVVGGTPFHELSLDGVQRNGQHMRLTGAVSDQGPSGVLAAMGGQLYVAVAGERIPVANGTTITLEQEVSPHVYVDYLLRVTDVATQPFWVFNAGDPMTVYEMTWEPADGGFQPRDLCPDPGDADELPYHHFVAFTGDRFDVVKKTVDSDPTSNWLNIACSGSAPAKLHLNRHTQSGATPGYFAGQPERQAMLKYLVADYCGDGEVHTVTGQPLRTINVGGWPSSLGPLEDPDNGVLGLADVTTVEAVWDKHGALCLDEPRLPSDPLDPVTKIWCKELLPSCVDDWPREEWKEAGGLFVTGNP